MRISTMTATAQLRPRTLNQKKKTKKQIRSRVKSPPTDRSSSHYVITTKRFLFSYTLLLDSCQLYSLCITDKSADAIE